jgi:hypothetical protein
VNHISPFGRLFKISLHKQAKSTILLLLTLDTTEYTIINLEHQYLTSFFWPLHYLFEATVYSIIFPFGPIYLVFVISWFNVRRR